MGNARKWPLTKICVYGVVGNTSAFQADIRSSRLLRHSIGSLYFNSAVEVQLFSHDTVTPVMGDKSDIVSRQLLEELDQKFSIMTSLDERESLSNQGKVVLLFLNDPRNGKKERLFYCTKTRPYPLCGRYQSVKFKVRVSVTRQRTQNPSTFSMEQARL